MEGSTGGDRPLTTAALAAASGYSPQQVRDLENLGVLPPAERGSNNYRRFGGRHLVALRAYRGLATAVGPVTARRTLREVRTLPLDEAAAVVSALHVELTRLRTEALEAVAALRAISTESEPSTASDAKETSADAMSIGELAEALGVRTSTLRFWEREGLVLPERVTSYGARRYRQHVIREARITAALRAAGYGIPAVRATVETVRALGDVDGPLEALQGRLTDLASRTVALVAAGADIAALLGAVEPGEVEPG
ncbi:MerR family transcriptional regulator [Prauserella rugosa]|uniref:DNA-binding transcriptional MerR regulator n=1 Tax=Prauserella rugosa TaxID=43354 RepID=A0A660CJ76_9PSEU|nr:MerR family transcriptional regulator [Prauserella rugosa]KMS86007.1 MerR family transcriptional regulator [Streptomyces regensis]TWH21673.1 DNA-binding transcriptional MerR regulator [Prauserella rugosa]